MGKTVLAAAVVEDPEIRAAFPDGIVGLQQADARCADPQRRLLAWVAPDKEPPTGVQAGRDALDTALKSRRWPIMLDDVWRHAACPTPSEVADTPSRLLITTRDEAVVRAGGAVPHVVEELTDPAARGSSRRPSASPRRSPPAATDVIEVRPGCPWRSPSPARLSRTLPKMMGCGVTWSQRSRRPTTSNCRSSSATPTRTPIAAIQAGVDFLPPGETGRLIFSLPSSPRILRSSGSAGEAVGHRRSQAAETGQAVRGPRAGPASG